MRDYNKLAQSYYKVWRDTGDVETLIDIILWDLTPEKWANKKKVVSKKLLGHKVMLELKEIVLDIIHSTGKNVISPFLTDGLKRMFEKWEEVVDYEERGMKVTKKTKETFYKLKNHPRIEGFILLMEKEQEKINKKGWLNEW